MEVVSFLRALVPWMDQGDSPQVMLTVNRVFFVIIWGALIVALTHEIRHLRRPVIQLKRLAEGITKLGVKRIRTREDVAGLAELMSGASDGLAHCWREFTETLIDHDELVYNAVDAESFFSLDRLRSHSLLPPRLISELPSLLTAAGILGTFLGLSLGLKGLNTADIDALQTGVPALIAGISTAYVTSIWGVTASVLFLLIERSVSGALRKSIRSLVATIDAMFQRKTEQSILVEMLEHTSDLAGTMKSFSTDLSDAVRKALDESVETHLAPHFGRMTELVSTVAEHSREAQTEGVQELVTVALEQIKEGITDQVEHLSDAMGAAVKDSRDFSVDMRQLLETIAARNSEQTELVSSFAGLLTDLRSRQTDSAEVMDGIAEAARTIAAVSGQFGEVHESMSGLQEKQLEANEATTEQMEYVASAAERTAASLSSCADDIYKASAEVVEQTRGLAQVISDGRERHDEAVEQLGALTEGMRDATNRFSGMITDTLGSIEKLGSLSEGLDGAVESLGTQANAMNDVSTNLRDSTARLELLADRMDEVRLSIDAFGDSAKEAVDGLRKTMEDEGATVSELHSMLGASMKEYATEVRKSVVDNLSAFDKHLGEATKSLGVVVKDLEDTIDEIGNQLSRLRG